MKQVGKMREIWKKSTWEVVTTLFWKISAKSTKLKFRILVLEFLMMSRSRISSLASRSRNFWWTLGLEVLWDLGLEGYGLDYITAISVANAKRKHNWNWSVKYYILRIRFNKISLLRMLLKCLKLTRITTIFRWCGTKCFLHTRLQNYTIWQHCSIIPMR